MLILLNSHPMVVTCLSITVCVIFFLLQRERELQHRLEEISDREFANRQEAMRLERLADELHVQKKDLEHRKFDLENFSGDGPGVMEEQRAELMERWERGRGRE